jgi:hypothetical protein
VNRQQTDSGFNNQASGGRCSIAEKHRALCDEVLDCTCARIEDSSIRTPSTKPSAGSKNLFPQVVIKPAEEHFEPNARMLQVLSESEMYQDYERAFTQRQRGHISKVESRHSPPVWVAPEIFWLLAPPAVHSSLARDTAQGRRRFVERLERRAAEENRLRGILVTEDARRNLQSTLRRGWFWGSQAFGQQLLASRYAARFSNRNYRSSEQAADHAQAHARRLLHTGMRALGIDQAMLEACPGSDVRKMLLARVIHERTAVPLGWIARALSMRSASNVCQNLRRRASPPKPRRSDASCWPLWMTDLRGSPAISDVAAARLQERRFQGPLFGEACGFWSRSGRVIPDLMTDPNGFRRSRRSSLSRCCPSCPILRECFTAWNSRSKASRWRSSTE